MSTPLPQFQFLDSLLKSLDRQLADLEKNNAASVFIEKRSTDQKIRAMAQGDGMLRSLTIDDTLLTTQPATLAANVKDVINQALSALNQTMASALSKAAFGWSFPGLPAQGQPLPDFAGFARTVNAVAAKTVAAGPCSQVRSFSSRSGPVTATVNASRQLTTLVFDDPLPALGGYLQQNALSAVNGAIALATDRADDRSAVVQSILTASAGFHRVPLYANNSLKVDDGVVIQDASGSGFGFVANAGTLSTNVAPLANVGTVLSVAPVTLQSGAHVHGFVRTSSSSVTQTGAIVDGQVVTGAVVALSDLALNVAFPGATAGSIALTTNQQASPPPAYYDQISVGGTNAKLTLSAGIYFCNNFVLDTGGQIVLDTTGGPIFLYVKTGFTFKGTIAGAPGSVPDVFVGYVGTNPAFVQGPWIGTLAAPNAKIDVASVAAPGHLGAFHGKDVEIHAGATVRHQPFGVLFEKLPGLVPPAAPFDTNAQLGFEDTSGWTSPQATLTKVTSPITAPGSFSLRVSNVVGSTDIFGPTFSTTNLTAPVSKLRFDLFISPNPPSPTPIGQVQVFITIPGANVYGASVGAASLNSLPRNAYSMIELPIPPTSLQAINNHFDAQLKIVLAVVSGSGPYFIDNIRFV
jgi:DNA-binding protein YbaB